MAHSYIPVGSLRYVQNYLLRKSVEVADYIRATVDILRQEEPQALWAAIQYCCQSRFDYWLRHCTPDETRGAARLIDDALTEAVAAAFRQGTQL